MQHNYDNLFLRSVTINDIDLIYKWSNDAIVRNNSFNTAWIPYDEHTKWFQNILKDKDVVFCILVSDNQDVGQVRIKICDEVGEVSYSIACEFRGKGFAKLILELAEEEVKGVVKQLMAKVKKDNFRSQSLFKLLGYKEIENVGYLVYEKELG